METQTTPHVQKGDLEVTGVSRSGRVRKKSSKLMDFQSPDEIETRLKKTPTSKTPSSTASKHHNTNFSTASTTSPTFGHQSPISSTQQQHILKEAYDNPSNRASYSPGMKSSDDDLYKPLDFLTDDDSLDDSGSDELMDDIQIPPDEDDDGLIDPTVRQSIYMSEKVNKKKIMKDGKVVFAGKAQRKDKGKTRFTAYMLWARDARKQMLDQQPDLDFAGISRRLGEMWANVPTSEKYSWKRRAKRLGTRSTPLSRKETARVLSTTSSKFLNRGQLAGNNLQGSGIATAGGGGGRTKKHSQTDLSSPNDTIEQHHHPQKKNSNSSSTYKVSPSAAPPIAIYKVTGIEPVDVAAHLKLLGDSLTIIGERLKEHEGQITVSGSLSVLMDSLLCSLGPLMCLTTQIPGFGDKNPHLKDALQNTLDNIAYVMPGL